MSTTSSSYTSAAASTLRTGVRGKSSLDVERLKHLERQSSLQMMQELEAESKCSRKISDLFSVRSTC